MIADTELRRGLLSVTLPGSAGKRTMLVVLGKKNLRFFTPPTPPDEAILTLGSPLPSGLATATALMCCCCHRVMRQWHRLSALTSCRVLPSQIGRDSTRTSFLTAARCVRRASACGHNPATALTDCCALVSQIAFTAWPVSPAWYVESVRAQGSSCRKRGERPVRRSRWSHCVWSRYTCVCDLWMLGKRHGGHTAGRAASHIRPR